MQNFKTVTSLCSCLDRFESYLAINPEDRFSRVVAQLSGLLSFQPGISVASVVLILD